MVLFKKKRKCNNCNINIKTQIDYSNIDKLYNYCDNLSKNYELLKKHMDIIEKENMELKLELEKLKRNMVIVK